MNYTKETEDDWQTVSLVHNNCSEFSEKYYLYIFFISLEFLKILQFFNGNSEIMAEIFTSLAKKSEKDNQKIEKENERGRTKRNWRKNEKKK